MSKVYIRNKVQIKIFLFKDSIYFKTLFSLDKPVIRQKQTRKEIGKCQKDLLVSKIKKIEGKKAFEVCVWASQLFHFSVQ